jgi:hypothetical protein
LNPAELNAAARFMALDAKERALRALTARPWGLALAAWLAASAEARRAGGWPTDRVIARAIQIAEGYEP